MATASCFLTSVNGKNFYDLTLDPRVLGQGITAPPGSIGLLINPFGTKCSLFIKQVGNSNAWERMATNVDLDLYALRNLSNLLNTAINADMLPDGDQTRRIGSEILAWLEVYTKNLVLSDVNGTNRIRKNLDQTCPVDPGFLPFASAEMMWLPDTQKSVKYEYNLIEAITGEIRHGCLQTIETFNSLTGEYKLYWDDPVVVESAAFPAGVEMDALMGGTALVPTMNYIRVKNPGPNVLTLQSTVTFVSKSVEVIP